MKLWLLKLKDGADYDEADGFVVRAKSARAARKMVGGQAGDEAVKKWKDGEFVVTWSPWESPKMTTCRQIKESGKAEIILRDFRAG